MMRNLHATAVLLALTAGMASPLAALAEPATTTPATDSAQTTTTTSTQSATTSTSYGNRAWKATQVPFRVVSGTGGAAAGMLTGGAKGVVQTERDFAANTFGRADENPFLIIPGVLGSIVAVPVGFIKGAPQGTQEGAKSGYRFWQRSDSATTAPSESAPDAAMPSATPNSAPASP